MSIRDKLKSRSKREQIDLGTEDPLFVKSMTGKDRSIFMDMSAQKANQNAVLVAISLVTESGDPVYGIDDIDEISELQTADIDLIVSVALRLNKLDEKSQESIEKNSE